MNLTSELSPIVATRWFDRLGRDVERRRLARIFEENYRIIWRLLGQLGLDAHAVDDAAQQVFLIVAERLDDVQPGKERSFCYGTALRVASSARRARRREAPLASVEAEPDSVPSPEQLTEQKRARDILDQALQSMSEDLRVVFIMFELDGFTTPEIADVLSIPLGTAASRLRRARDEFRRLVAPQTPSMNPRASEVP
jgi:RNA polymerase sigma-70 factor (ECF subfamily)